MLFWNVKKDVYKRQGPISRLDDIGTRQGKDAYFRAVVSKDEKLYPRWQRYNLSFDNALKLAEKQF